MCEQVAPDGMTIARRISHYAAATPDAPFFISPRCGAREERVVSWRELAAAMPAVEFRLRELRADVGAPVAYMMQNGWTAAQLLLGGMHCGRVMLPLNIASGDAQIAYALRQSECRVVFADEENHERLCGIIAHAGEDIRVCAVERDEGIAADGLSDSPNTSESLAVSESPTITPQHRALLMYTSGTTGMPKGVAHTQRSMLAGGANTARAHRLTAADRGLCVLPLFHINALCVSVMSTLMSGGGIVMPTRFRTSEFWRLIRENECTWFSVVPTMISYLLGAPDEPGAQDSPPPMPHLRFGRSASAPLSPSAHRRFEQRFNIPMIETMGLTETAAQILSNPLPPGERKIGSPGIPYGNEVAIMDEHGNFCKDGEVGELVARGDNVMLEYNDNPEETAKTFFGDWLRTGDLGYRDADGYFFITGRKKELIIKGGENIAPREIDEALLQLPQIIDAAAFPRPCERYGQRVEACVITRGDSAISESEIINHCHKIVGKFKSPDHIYFVDEMPRGPSGKVQRLKLADIMSAPAAKE